MEGYSLKQLMDSTPIFVQLSVAALLLSIAYFLLSKDPQPNKDFPVISLDKKSAKTSFRWHGVSVINKGLEQCTGGFQVITGNGPKILFPNRFAEELGTNPNLSFNEGFATDFFVDLPGFEPHRQMLNDANLIQDTARKMTQSLNLVTNDIVDETITAVHDIFGENDEWHPTSIWKGTSHLTARVTSRVFLGLPLCRNEEWLEIVKEYSVKSFISTAILRMVPAPLRSVAHWFVLYRLRSDVKAARRLLGPEIERKMAAIESTEKIDDKPSRAVDSVSWMAEVAGGRKIDWVAGQLALVLTTMHTTTVTTVNALLDLCEHPETIEPLRKEAVRVLGKHGWSRTSLGKLRLMDSFLKESQRMNPLGATSINRLVKKDVHLSDGSHVPERSRISVVNDNLNPAVYPNPMHFDPTRFLAVPEHDSDPKSIQDEDSKHAYLRKAADLPFTAPSPQHMGFGYGLHACPGRFFAANLIKTALCVLLLKYDWKLLEGEGRPGYLEFEGNRSLKFDARVMIRRRMEDVDFDELVAGVVPL